MTKKETYLTCQHPNIFEGMTSISAILNKYEQNASEKRTIVRILFDQTKVKSKARELAFLRRMSSKYNFIVSTVSSQEIDALVTGHTHGGIVAVCEPRTIPFLSEKVDEIKEDGVYIMLDGIEDPYNFGYALRSIYAAGADGVILPHRNWMDVAGIVAKSSAGASELINMYISDPTEAVALFKEKDYLVVCSGIRNSVSMYDANLKKPIFLIVGGEKRGVSSAVEQTADIIARIEYGRDFRGSLSAASAATVMMYEIYRQNR